MASVIVSPCPQKKQKLTKLSKTVARSVSELIDTAKQLEEGNTCDSFLDHMKGAVACIEDAERKLGELKPRFRDHESSSSRCNFEEQIFEATKSIAAASTVLVKAATSAQQEHMRRTVDVSQPATDNNELNSHEWTHKLTHAARLVATATESLCKVASDNNNKDNAAAEYEEKIISSVKSIAFSSAQLLLACEVRIDPNTCAGKLLHTAGGNVRNAAEKLINVAKGALGGIGGMGDGGVGVGSSPLLAGGLRDELEIQEVILKKEKELERAKVKLFHIRKARGVVRC